MKFYGLKISFSLFEAIIYNQGLYLSTSQTCIQAKGVKAVKEVQGVEGDRGLKNVSVINDAKGY